MHSKRWALRAVAALALWIFHAPLATAADPAADPADCLAAVASADLAAKRAYQTGLSDLVLREAPRFAELAGLSRELQLALAEARHRELRYLLRHAPARLKTDDGLAAFTNFDWSAEDGAHLRAEDAAFQTLQERIDALSARSDGHADWPALRALFRDELGRSEAFTALTADFAAARTRAEARLADCRAR